MVAALGSEVVSKLAALNSPHPKALTGGINYYRTAFREGARAQISDLMKSRRGQASGPGTRFERRYIHA